MAVRRVRVEFIRFGLLLTMTVALISVATRHDDNSTGRNQASRGHHQSSTAPSPSSGQTEAPSQGGSTPSGSSGEPSTPSGGNDGSTRATSGGGGETSAPTLPRTGGTQALELAALAVLLIGAGSFGVRISRPRTSAVQADGPPTAATHIGHAFGSSESNRPGTT